MRLLSTLKAMMTGHWKLEKCGVLMCYTSLALRLGKIWAILLGGWTPQNLWLLIGQGFMETSSLSSTGALPDPLLCSCPCAWLCHDYADRPAYLLFLIWTANKVERGVWLQSRGQFLCRTTLQLNGKQSSSHLISEQMLS